MRAALFAAALLATGSQVRAQDICRDWGNDCCANMNDGERAACADGYTPSRQPTSWDSCEYQCLPDSTCEATSATHEVQCCKPNACIEDNGLDYDCCSPGTASSHEPKNSVVTGRRVNREETTKTRSSHQANSKSIFPTLNSDTSC